MLTLLLFAYQVLFDVQGDVTAIDTVSLSKTSPYEWVTHPDTPSRYWGKVSAPYPTGAFWTNFVVEEGIGSVATHPYGIQCEDGGVFVSYSATRRMVSDLRITDPFDKDVQITSQEAYLDRGIEKYDNLSVTMAYSVQSSSGSPAGFQVPLVKGSPYITVVYRHCTPVISSKNMRITSVEEQHGIHGEGFSGYAYVVTLGNFQKWLIYSSACKLQRASEESDRMIANGPVASGFVRVAIIPQNPDATEDAVKLLLKHVEVYPTGGRLAISYPSSKEAIMRYEFITSSGRDAKAKDIELLMYALPHHVDLMSPSMFTRHVKAQHEAQQALLHVYSVKGMLSPILGNHWELKLPLQDVGFEYITTKEKEKLTRSQLNKIAAQLRLDAQSIRPQAEDPYNMGKQLGRMARLASMADFLDISEAKRDALSAMKTGLKPWLGDSNADMLGKCKIFM